MSQAQQALEQVSAQNAGVTPNTRAPEAPPAAPGMVNLAPPASATSESYGLGLGLGEGLGRSFKPSSFGENYKTGLSSGLGMATAAIAGGVLWVGGKALVGYFFGD
jgi:hypothetical protein